jgi:hypothetical protein
VNASALVGRRVSVLVIALMSGASGCVYDPPPEVTLVAPPHNRFMVGEPILLAFSEPVNPESLEVRVWPGKEDLYDSERQRLPWVEPVMEICTPATSPCDPGGVVLSLSENRTGASIEVPDEALGPCGQPLVLEVTGRIENDAGRSKKVSRFFDFQIVREVCDMVVREPGEDALDVRVTEGAHFFFAEFTTPIKLPQQFWVDIRVDHAAGRFLMVLTDADPKDGMPRNTDDPTKCVMDKGDEGFLFTARGRLCQESPGADPVFEGEAFTLALTIGPILFELRDVVMRGTVSVEDGLSRWDGTMAVREVYYQVGDIEQVYPEDQANFRVFQVRDSDIPQGMPRVCDDDPCAGLAGMCGIPEGASWPVPQFCPE